MGILDFLFGGKKEMKILREDVAKEIAGLRQDIRERQSALEKENKEMLQILASFENDIQTLKEDAKRTKSNETEKLERRIAMLESMMRSLKSVGRLSLQNYDAIRSIEPLLKKLESMIEEHIAAAPEVIISKDEYSEELGELKKRLDALENKELIILSQSKKKKKS